MRHALPGQHARPIALAIGREGQKVLFDRLNRDRAFGGGLTRTSGGRIRVIDHPEAGGKDYSNKTCVSHDMLRGWLTQWAAT
jgi:hypothetical protein